MSEAQHCYRPICAIGNDRHILWLGIEGGRVLLSVGNNPALFQVWLVHTEQAPHASDLILLDAAERDRGSRYLRQSDRNRFLKTRAMLRRLLGRMLEREPRSIRFNKNSFGKPILADNSARSVSFSVSHTDVLSVVAISDGRRIGIDVERLRPIADRGRIATRVFGASIARALTDLNEDAQDRAFLRMWTAVEAFLKAKGTGFAGIQDDLPLVFCEKSGTVSFGGQKKKETPMSLITLSLPEGFLGSVVVEGGEH